MKAEESTEWDPMDQRAQQLFYGIANDARTFGIREFQPPSEGQDDYSQLMMVCAHKAQHHIARSFLDYYGCHQKA